MLSHSWHYHYPIPTHIIRALHKQPRLDQFSCIATCCGTREELEALRMLEDSTKVDEFQIHTGWVEDWTKLFPRTPSNELSTKFCSQRVLLSKDVFVRLPRLKYLELNFDLTAENSTIPFDFLEIKSFPEVTELTINYWVFGYINGPNALENRICPSVLQKLTVVGAFQIDHLFNILAWQNVQLNCLTVMVAQDVLRPALAVGLIRWPAFARFLLQQRSMEELILHQCEIQTSPMLRCLLHNKTSLKTLDLHLHERYPEIEGQAKGNFNASIPSGSLRRIRNTCQVLDTLKIDLPILELIAVSPIPFLNASV